MKSNIIFLCTVLISLLILISCEKKCFCELVVYESTFETDYEWIENNRVPSEECERDTLSSAFLDDNGNISYVRTILECN